MPNIQTFIEMLELEISRLEMRAAQLNTGEVIYGERRAEASEWTDVTADRIHDLRNTASTYSSIIAALRRLSVR